MSGFEKPAPGQPYPPEVRAQCVAAMSTGATIDALHAQTGISRRTLQYWKVQSGATPSASEGQKEEIGKLIVENLTAGLGAMQNILELFSDPEYIRKFGPGELANTFGMIADKNLRILQAFTPPTSESDD